MLVVSYIYGVIYSIEEIAKFCKERGILLVEDIAESYIGNEYTGSNRAMLSLFSFGGIKRYTAFGGALAFIRDHKMFTKMNAIHNKFPVQTKRECFNKLVKVAAMYLLLNTKYPNLYTKKASRVIQFDYKEFVVKNLRGFQPQKDFLAKFKKRPNVATLHFMHHRLSTFDKAQFDETNQKLLVQSYR